MNQRKKNSCRFSVKFVSELALQCLKCIEIRSKYELSSNNRSWKLSHDYMMFFCEMFRLTQTAKWNLIIFLNK